MRSVIVKTSIKKILVVKDNCNGTSGGDYHIGILSHKYKKDNDIDVEFIDMINNAPFNFTNILKSMIKIKTWNKDGRYDIILCSSPYIHHVIQSLYISRKKKIPMTVYFHHVVSLNFHPFRRGFLRAISYSIYWNFLLAFVKILKIPIFLDNHSNYNLSGITIYEDEDAPSTGKHFDSNIDKIYDVCYVGRFQKHKGSNDLVNFIITCVRKGLNYKMAVVGKISPEYKNRVVRKLARFGAEKNIVFTGFLQENEKNEVVSSSKVFISLSYEEGWSLAVMDAASAGIPVLAYNLPAYSYLKGNYFPISSGNIDEAVEKFKFIMENYNVALEKAREARKQVLKYSYDKITSYQLNCYNDIINSNT